MKTQTVVEHFGSQANLAAAIGITQPNISKWGEDVPLKYQLVIQYVTRGKFKAVPQPLPLPPRRRLKVAA